MWQNLYVAVKLPLNFKDGAALCSEEQNTSSGYTFCVGHVVKVSQER